MMKIYVTVTHGELNGDLKRPEAGMLWWSRICSPWIPEDACSCLRMGYKWHCKDCVVEVYTDFASCVFFIARILKGMGSEQ